MILATRLTEHCAEQHIERNSPHSTYVILSEDGVTVCMTDSMLDTWFSGLAPEVKAAIYELVDDGPADQQQNVLQALMLRNGIGGFVEAVDHLERGFTHLCNAPITRTPSHEAVLAAMSAGAVSRAPNTVHITTEVA